MVIFMRRVISVVMMVMGDKKSRDGSYLRGYIRVDNGRR